MIYENNLFFWGVLFAGATNNNEPAGLAAHFFYIIFLISIILDANNFEHEISLNMYFAIILRGNRVEGLEREYLL